MSNRKTVDEKPSATPALPFPALIGFDWAKPLSEGPFKLHGEMLNFMAKRLRAQADYLQAMATCQNPNDFIKEHAAFMQDSFGAFSEEVTKSWNAVQDSTSPSQS